MKTLYTCYTCILGPYEKLKEVKVITPGWRYLAYTDQEFTSDTWEIVKIPTPSNPRKRSRIIKAMFHLFVDTEYSLYIDGSFTVNCDLNEFWAKYFVAPFSCPSHPERDCVYEEAQQCIDGQRGGISGIEQQVESYRDLVPPHNGLITSGILLRQRTRDCVLMCMDWALESTKEGNSLRDQISFCKISMKPEWKSIIHTFEYKYSQEYSFLFTPHRDVIINGVNYF